MSWNRIIRSFCCLLLPSLLASTGIAEITSAADPSVAKDVEVRKLTITPAPEPSPALKYVLLPSALDRTPGNAAAQYNRILLLLEDRLDDETSKKLKQWGEDDFQFDNATAAEARKALRSLDPVMTELSVACRRTSCVWDPPLREGEAPFAVLHPELQRYQELIRVPLASIRLALYEGRTDDAIQVLQTGFAFARDVGNGPTLIHGLLGVIFARMLAVELENLVQRPDAPNLYWALSVMPRPLVDMRPGLENERHTLGNWIPALRNIDTLGDDPAFWQTQLGRICQELESSGLPEPQAGFRATVAMYALKGYPKAVDYMVSKGYTREQVAAMHSARVLVTAVVEPYRQLRDNAFKWLYLPYSEAWAGLDAWENEFHEKSRDTEVFPLAKFLLPTLNFASVAVAREQRAFELVRTVEAVRMYAALHDGQLPRSAQDITEVPFPTDPFTGKPFELTREGDAVVIQSLPPLARDAERHALRLEIRLAK